MKIFKMLFSAILMLTMIVGTAVANGDIESYSLHYNIHVPTSENRSSQVLKLYYYSGGYEANCSSFTLSNGSLCLITTTSAGGIAGSFPYIPFTHTGYINSWTLNGSTTGLVSYTVAVSIDTTPSGTNWYTGGKVSIYGHLYD